MLAHRRVPCSVCVHIHNILQHGHNACEARLTLHCPSFGRHEFYFFFFILGLRDFKPPPPPPPSSAATLPIFFFIFANCALSFLNSAVSTPAVALFTTFLHRLAKSKLLLVS